MIYSKIGIALLATMLLNSCNDFSVSDGGSGSQTTNTITGVVESGGNPSAGVVLTLYPESFNPLTGSVPDSLRAISSGNGTFQFAGLDGSQAYNIQALAPESRKGFLIWGIKFAGKGSHTVALGVTELKDPGKIRVILQDFSPEVNDKVYIPGTGIQKNISETEIENNQVVIEGVPPSLFAVLNHSPSEGGEPVNILAEEVEVVSGEIATRGPFAEWSDTTSFVINTSATGADIGSDLYNYPLLVRVNPEDFPANTDASDIRFSKSDGITLLDHEVEIWDESSGTGAVWVRIDTLMANNNTQFIQMFTGNDSAKDIQNSHNVFKAAQDYIGVWHLNAVASDSFSDASSNLNHGYSIDDPDNIIVGPSVSGEGVTLADSQFIQTSMELESPDVFTISLWFNTEVAGGRLMGFNHLPDSASPSYDRHIYMGDDGRVHFGVYPPQPDSIPPEDSVFVGLVGLRRILSSSEAYDDGVWHHVAGVLSPQGQRFYLDGVEVGHNPDVTLSQSYRGAWRMGHHILRFWNYKSEADSYHGQLDEVRISHSVRNADWIKMSFENQKPGSGVVEIK